MFASVERFEQELVDRHAFADMGGPPEVLFQQVHQLGDTVATQPRGPRLGGRRNSHDVDQP
jgi:hypothetical protein